MAGSSENVDFWQEIMEWSGPRGNDGIKIRIVPSGRVMRYKPCIISGGQTGVDRGALDAALSLDWPCGGTCPEGRRDELGVIPQHYPLTESSSSEWEVRTRINVDNADATLILVHEEPLAGGTRLTAEYAAQKGKPVRVEVAPWDQESTAAWVKAHAEAVLNVAGPRESGAPGIGRAAERFVSEVLLRLQATASLDVDR